MYKRQADMTVENTSASQIAPVRQDRIRNPFSFGGQGAAGTQRAAGACQQMAFGVEQGQAVDGVAHRFQRCV